jgi:hypothetical protein
MGKRDAAHHPASTKQITIATSNPGRAAIACISTVCSSEVSGWLRSTVQAAPTKLSHEANAMH